MTDPKAASDYVQNPNYTQSDWDEVSDNPELTDDELARMRSGGEGLPPELSVAFKSRGGRPRLDAKRVPVSLRIDPDVLAAFKATGAGWQTRMNEALAEAAKKLVAA